MAFDDDAVSASEDIVDAVGESVVYHGGGSPATITAIFDRDSILVEGDELEYQTFDALLTAKSSDVPGLEEGHMFTVDGVDYECVLPQPDGLGLTNIRLNKLALSA